ncbi:MAG: AgmX/PglI C-terminal domain-containing protein [Gemmatimonadaceae bacterium]
MATAAAPGPSRGRGRDETTFTRALKFEALGEEGRPVVVSYAISITLGILWLLAVWFLPAAPNSIELMSKAEMESVDLTLQDEQPAATPAPKPEPPPVPVPKNLGGGNNQKTPKPGGSGNTAAAAGAAFGGGNQGGVVGDVTGILRGVEVSSGSGDMAGGRGGKAVIGYGQGAGAGSRNPGAGGFGSGIGTGVGSGIGGVGGGAGGVGRVQVSVAAPRAIKVENVGGPGRDVNELGNYVRSHQAALRFCYEEYGLKRNPNLAGTIAVAISMTGDGSVSGVDIPSRSWSGAGASEVESCIQSRISGWHFPASAAGKGTYSFPFNFTR